MTEWQPIETAPENTDILVYSDWRDECRYSVDHFRWRTTVHEDVESETRNAKGRRKIIQEREERDREWNRDGWGATHWMALPAAPLNTP